MSDDEGSQMEQPIEPPKEEPGKKFFLSHMNSYTGRAILKELQNRHLVREPELAAHTFYGTMKIDEKGYKENVVPEGTQSVYSMDRTKEFRDTILQSDVIIYDLQTNTKEEVDYVIKTLKTNELNSQKTLILLSSVMTWVNTPQKIQKELQDGEEPEEGGEPEEEEPEEEEVEEGEQGEPEEVDENGEPIKKPKVLYFKESDYHLRVPLERYQHYKTLETLAMSSVKTQPKLTVHVLCSGIRYGNGEDSFYGLFERAWLQNPPYFEYLGKGDNLIPTIHVIDLARLVKRVVDDKINKQYIFAIDRTRKPTQKRILESISKGIGTGATQSTTQLSYDFNINEFLKINLKMKASDAFKDKEPPEDTEEDPDELAKKLKFPWHCEKGIIDNIRNLNNEFNQFRNLNPVKIFITGPPASGKSFYADQLAFYYNIPKVNVQQLVARAYEMAKVEEGGTELHEEIKSKIEELRDAMVAEIEEKRAESGQDDNGEEPEEIDRESLKVRLPDELLFKLLNIRLKENDCRNRGYILDGYPRTFKQAQEVFLIREKKFDEEGNEIEEEEPELEEGEEKSYEGYIPNAEIFPKSVLVLNGDDQFLIQRVKDLPESQIQGTHYNYQDMVRRLKSYRDANNSQIAEPSIQQFFQKQGLQIYEDNCQTDSATVLKSFKIYIERFEKPNNYMTYDQQEEEYRRNGANYDKMMQSYKDEEKQLREELVEKELRKQKEAYTKQRLDQIKEYERDLLDTKSQPIRQYLMDNLVPILTDGLIEVCRKSPDDPVDYLAEYLFKRALDVPYPDPTSY